MRAFINDFLKEKLDNFLHRNPEVAETLEKKIKQAKRSERNFLEFERLPEIERRKRIFTIKNYAIAVFTSQMQECHVTKKQPCSLLREIRRVDQSRKSRDVNTQAVFSLRGKPLNVSD